jgi:hypothetical protein
MDGCKMSQSTENAALAHHQLTDAETSFLRMASLLLSH